MRVSFTKMQGAGNDFVVIDATEAPFALSRDQLQRLGDRRFGVGADQILVVEPGRAGGADFGYRIFNGADGNEVEQCGNGARCFLRFVLDHDLTQKPTVTVDTLGGRLTLVAEGDGRVRVDMGAPGGFSGFATIDIDGHTVEAATLSMGNPHLVQFVADVDSAPVEREGRLLQQMARFPGGVNAGFAQVMSRGRIRLRVYERGAGETLACGTGACAAVVAGIESGRLDERVDVEARGGVLTIEWPRAAQGTGARVLMTGPADKVFDGEIEL